MNESELQTAMLHALSTEKDTRLGGGQHYLADAIAKNIQGQKPSPDAVHRAIWSLVSQGLAYINMSQPAPENWKLCLTAAGRAAVADEAFNPDDPGRFLSRLRDSVPEMSATVQHYTEEAVRAYTARLYTASTLLVGIASEAAFLEIAPSLANALTGKSRENYLQAIQNRSKPMLSKFKEFQKRIEPLRKTLPSELGNNINLFVNPVLDLLRTQRNEAGHPSGTTFDREDCNTTLAIFGRYLNRLYALRAHFAGLARHSAIEPE